MPDKTQYETSSVSYLHRVSAGQCRYRETYDQHIRALLCSVSLYGTISPWVLYASECTNTASHPTCAMHADIYIYIRREREEGEKKKGKRHPEESLGTLFRTESRSGPKHRVAPPCLLLRLLRSASLCSYNHNAPRCYPAWPRQRLRRVSCGRLGRLSLRSRQPVCFFPLGLPVCHRPGEALLGSRPVPSSGAQPLCGYR